METYERSPTSWNSPHRGYWAVLISVFLAGLFVLGAFNIRFNREYLHSQAIPANVPKGESVLVRVLIDFGATKRAFQGKMVEGMTIGSALAEIVALANLPLEVRNGTIIALGAERAKAGGPEWKVSRNGVVLEKNSLKENVRAGDRIEVRYQ